MINLISEILNIWGVWEVIKMSDVTLASEVILLWRLTSEVLLVSSAFFWGRGKNFVKIKSLNIYMIKHSLHISGSKPGMAHFFHYHDPFLLFEMINPHLHGHFENHLQDIQFKCSKMLLLTRKGAKCRERKWLSCFSVDLVWTFLSLGSFWYNFVLVFWWFVSFLSINDCKLLMSCFY